MKISDGILKQAERMIRGHLKDYQSDIEVAYLKADNALDVTLKVKFTPEGSGIQLDTSISFVAEKIKDSASQFIDENQRQIFDSVEAMRPKKGSGIDKIEISSGEKTAVLNAE